jgi:hypothetical protein
MMHHERKAGQVKGKEAKGRENNWVRLESQVLCLFVSVQKASHRWKWFCIWDGKMKFKKFANLGGFVVAEMHEFIGIRCYIDYSEDITFYFYFHQLPFAFPL